MSPQKFHEINFSEPTNISELARYIGTDEKTIKFSLLRGENTPFIMHRIPKKNRKAPNDYRIVWQSHPLLEDAYKSFTRRFHTYASLTDPRYPHNHAFGYIKGKNTIDNATLHCKKQYILHADIESFFPSITQDRIKFLMKSLNLHDEIIEILSSFVTIDKALPLGIHSSPLIANLICLDLDDKFQELASSFNCDYTRYADDITISGCGALPSKVEVKKILNDENFNLSQYKFRITKPGQAHYVTGLSVINDYPRAPRSMKKRLRQELYFCKKYGIKNHIDRITSIKKKGYFQKAINRIDGMVRYISHIEKKTLPNLTKEWKELLAEQGLTISYVKKKYPSLKNIKFFVDESEITHKGKKYLALSFVQTEEFEKISEITTAILNNHIRDPFSDGKKQDLKKRGLHYSDATQDLRKSYIDQLATLPFKGYLAYNVLPSYNEYSDVYISLLKSLLPHRLMGCDDARIEIIFEENSKIKPIKIKNVVNEIYATLAEYDNRRPNKLDISIGKKLDHPCFSVPDFLLGAFKNYATLNGNNGLDRNRLLFEKIRDKYRIILDDNLSIFYTRKNPFIPWGSS